MLISRPVLLGALLLSAANAFALPRFAARTGWKCQSCHVNPTGGAMRQVLGAQYGREKLPVPEWSRDLELEDFSTLLTSMIGVGADVRTMYYVRQVPGGAGDSSNNAFWQMQGDLYLNFKLARNVNVYLDKGLYSGFEIFGMLGILPANGYIKVGKFMPGFGVRTDDHTAYVRTKTGFSPETGRPEKTGLEAGIAPGPFSLLGGVYNAADGFGLSGNQKSVLVRAEWQTSFSEDLHLAVGGNGFLTSGTAGDRRDLYGGFGMAAVGGIAIVGEVDLIRDKRSGTTTRGFVASSELSVAVLQGVDVKLTYDFYDENTSLKTGSTARYGAGFEFFPLSGVELRPMYRITRETPVDRPDNEFLVLLHFYL